MEAAMHTWRTAIGLATAGLALVGPAAAQEKPAIPIPDVESRRPAPDPPPSRTTHVTGKVQSVSDNLLTLTDGRQLVIMPGLIEQRGDLKPGVTIKANYAETAGRKVITTIQVDPK